MSDYKMKMRALYAATAASLQSRIRWGQNIYSEDWDALIILDACRVDALREVQSEYDFLSNIESRWSTGSTSKEWLENTFINDYKDEISSTTYITANYYATHLRKNDASRLEYPMARDKTVGERVFQYIIKDDVVSSSDFGDFITLFDKLVSENEKQLHPEDVTDCAINTSRETDSEHVIIHYMQPHHPFLQSDPAPQWHKEPFGYLNDGGDFEKVWDGYLGNLRLVLDHVEKLLGNLDAEKTVITADHGELFGEWGMNTHAVGIPHPDLRKVPWVETTARDTESYMPNSVVANGKVSDEVIEDRLDALGYR